MGKHWQLWLVVGVALALRLAASTFDVRPGMDEAGYHQLAQRWLATGRFADTYRSIGEPRDGLMVAWRSPGYPAFLAALYRVGLPSRAVAPIQALLGALTAALVYLLACRVSPRPAPAPRRPRSRRRAPQGDEGERRVALWAGLLFALSLGSILYGGRLMSETLSVALFAGSLLALVSRRPGWAGLLLGAGILVRPALALCAPAFVVVALWQERSWRPAAVCGAAVALVVLPWVARNVAVGVGPVLTTSDGYDLYLGNNPLARTGGWHWASGAVVLRRALPEAEMNRTFTREALAWIRAHPAAYLRLCGRRLAALYGFGTDAWFPAWREVFLPIRVLVAPAVWIALVWGLRRWREHYPLLLPLLAYTGGVALTFADPRMREPLGPIVCVLLSMTALRAFEWYRLRKAVPARKVAAAR